MLGDRDRPRLLIPAQVEEAAARIAQGTATLEQHAIAGYQGSAGVMPAKGGRMDLSDDAVKAAVGHMVSQSR